MDRSPGGQCTICNHPQRLEIDKALVSGESYRSVAKRFGVTDSAVGRHKRGGHIAAQIAKVARKGEIKESRAIKKAVEEMERREIADVISVLDEIVRLKDRLNALLDRAEKEGIKEVCMVSGEVRRTLELIAKISGELKDAGAVTVNIIQSAEFKQVIAILQEELSDDAKERFARRLYEIGA